jgi:hypothetical protein
MTVKITEPAVADKNVKTDRSANTGNEDIQVVAAGPWIRTYIAPISAGDVDKAATSSVQSLTVPSGARYATIFVEGTADTDFIRFRHSTPAPTATTGVKLSSGYAIDSPSPSTFQFILGSGSGACTLRIEFWDSR